MKIIGISCFYHDSAACLIDDGIIVAAAHEERFTRIKHDANFPRRAVDYCLLEAGIKIEEIDAVVFYDKPFLKFERIIETYLAYVPFGFFSYLKAMQVWLKQKLWIATIIKSELGYKGELLFTEHHQAHAASAFFPSPFKRAAFLTVDGVGEWATTSYGIGVGNKLSIKKEIHFPHSLGLLYSAFTYYTGFKVNSGEYKLMGLAPYGEPKYKDKILENLIDIKDGGSFHLNMEYFNFPAGLTMTNEKFHNLFGGPPRKSESEITQREMDLASSIQAVTEELMLKIARHIHNETGEKYLCLAGGVALNCVSNQKLLQEGPFDDIWIQPASGDAGGALGAALFVWHEYFDGKREVDDKNDLQQGSYLGPEYNNVFIKNYLDKKGAVYTFIKEDNELFDETAKLIEKENVVGWYQGRMEYGPRALGNRSIIGDARSSKMQSEINLKIKFRESFRPFAPSVLEENIQDYFQLDRPSPYMLLTALIQKDKQKEPNEKQKAAVGLEKLFFERSEIPAVTHVDYSARLQSVNKNTNKRYHALISAFYKLTGCPVIINTSFNVRGEPIVCTPEDAYKCFMRTNMDYLVMGNYLLSKIEQPKFNDIEDWQSLYELD